MKNFKFIKPKNDDNLTFNQNTGRYQLTIQYVKDEINDHPYKDDAETKRRIKLNSRVVYDYINLKVATVNKTVVWFLLHNTQEGRDFLLELLSAQMYADVQTGYNDLLYQPPISYSGGNDKDRAIVKQNLLCPAAEIVFEDSFKYFGFNIEYQGQLPYPYYLLVRNY